MAEKVVEETKEGRYDEIYEGTYCQAGYPIFKKARIGEKQGLISRDTGEEIYPFKYALIKVHGRMEPKSIIIYKDAELGCGVTTLSGEEISSGWQDIRFDGGEVWSHNSKMYISVYDGQGWGVIDDNGQQQLECLYGKPINFNYTWTDNRSYGYFQRVVLKNDEAKFLARATYDIIDRNLQVCHSVVCYDIRRAWLQKTAFSKERAAENAFIVQYGNGKYELMVVDADNVCFYDKLPRTRFAAVRWAEKHGILW